MPDQAVLCRHFTQLRDAFHDHADKIQKLIDEIVAELGAVLVNPWLAQFLDGMKAAKSDAERVAVAKAVAAEILRNLRKLMKAFADAAAADVPTDPWPLKAKKLLEDLEALLQALIALRALEEAMDAHAAAWCE